MDELCMCLSPSSNNNRNISTSSCAVVDASNSSSLNSNISDTVDNHYSPITPAFANHNHTTSVSLPDPHMFNYPTMVDGNHLSFDPGNQPSQYQYNWDNPTPHSTYPSPSEKQLSYYDLPSDLPYNKSSNASSLPQISSSNNLQDLIMNLDFIDPCNNLDTDWCKNYYENDDNTLTIETSETESIVKKEMVDTVIDTQLCDYSQTIGNENHASPVFKQSPKAEPSMSHRRIKSRPAPIFIPPQTSAHMSRLRSPRFWNTGDRDESKIPPYTPPPMLSPQRRGSGLFNSVWNNNGHSSGNLSATIGPWSASFVSNTVTTTSSCYANDMVVSTSSLCNHQNDSEVIYSHVNNHISPMWFKEPVRNGDPEHFIYQEDYLDYQPQSVDDTDGLPTSATPRINIGPQHQAQLPVYNNDKKQAREDRRLLDALLWDPKQFKDTLENTSSLDLLMKIASSPAVKSCGLNMEYTFHLLCKFKGDLEKTLQALLEDSFVVYDYVYAETTNWTTEEINKFQERLKKHDRDFMRVALDLQSCGMNKSVKACVEFYYVWKQMNNVKDINRFLVKSSRKKLLAANNSVLRYEDSCASNMEDLSSARVAAESGYYLRKRFPSGNQASSDSSSTESGPAYCKPQRIGSSFYAERVKRPQSYHCTQCKRKFAKSKALDNHMRSHNGTNIINDKRWLR